MEIGTKIKFAYTDSQRIKRQGIKRQGIEVITRDILGEDVLSNDQVIERLIPKLQKFPKAMLLSSGFLLAARYVLKKDPGATDISVDEARQQSGNGGGGDAGGAILILAIIAIIVAIICFPLLVMLGMHNKLFLKNFYNKYSGEAFDKFVKNYTYIGIALYALVAILIAVDSIFELYMLMTPAFGILFFGGIAYFVVSLILLKKKFGVEGEKLNFMETLKGAFKKEKK